MHLYGFVRLRHYIVQSARAVSYLPTEQPGSICNVLQRSVDSVRVVSDVQLSCLSSSAVTLASTLTILMLSTVFEWLATAGIHRPSAVSGRRINSVEHSAI